MLLTHPADDVHSWDGCSFLSKVVEHWFIPDDHELSGNICTGQLAGLQRQVVPLVRYQAAERKEHRLVCLVGHRIPAGCPRPTR